MGKPRRTQIIRIPELMKRRVSFSKRSPTVFKKGWELSVLTDSDVSVLVRSATGKSEYRRYQRGKLIDNIARRKGKVDSSMGPREWEEDLIKQECDACETMEDLRSIIATCEARLAYARERLRNWQNNPSVREEWNAENFPDEEIDALLQDWGVSNPVLWALGKDSVGHGDCESSWTSLVNSATDGASNPTSSGLDACELNMDDLRNFSSLRISDSDRPENSVIGGPSNPMCCGLDDCEFNPDDYLDIPENYIGDGDCPEN